MDGSVVPRASTPQQHPVFGRGGADASIELVRAAAGQREPFVVLASGRFSQILLAEGTFGSIGLKRRFALKLQRGDYAAEANSQLTNLDVEAMWRHEAADLARVDSPHVVPSLPIAPGVLPSRPVAFCRRTEAWFHPPCPRTGAPLTVCRDDELLSRSGLPTFSQSLVRYLTAPTANGKPPRVFYRLPGTAPERPASDVVVRIGAQLWRDYQEALAAGALPPGSLPCQTCEHRGACFPAATGKTDAGDAAIPAEEQLCSVSYYDFLMLPLELLDLQFDTLCDWLGGKQLPASTTRAAPAAPEWLFASDPQRWWAEVLHLKLSAFAEVCTGLRDLHAQAGRPHLGVSPANTMAELLPHGDAMPARWHSRVRLIDLGSAAGRDRASGEGVEPAVRLLEPGSDVRGTTFENKRLAEQDELAARLRLRVDNQAPEGELVRLGVTIDVGALDVRAFRAGDLLEARPTDGGRAVWLELVEVRPGRIVATTRLAPLHPFAALPIGAEREAACVFRKVFGPASDLFGLGMLLFRMLLVNDERDLFRVQEAVEQSLRRIGAETRAAQDDAGFDRLVRNCLRDHGTTFGSEAVFHRQQDRNQDHAPLDTALWPELLTFAFRLVTWIPGVSFASGHGDVPGPGRGALLDQVLAQVQGFRRRTHAELFRPERATEIRQACLAARLAAEGELMDSLRASAGKADATSAGARPATEPANAEQGFRLTITQDGSPLLTRSYQQEQVTIGRRENNLVVLKQEHVSSRHAVIERSGNTWFLIDRDSRNGTWLNGERVVANKQEQLRSGDSIVIGPYAMEFEDLGDMGRTMAFAPAVSSRPLADELLRGYAEAVEAGETERRERLDNLLQQRLRADGPKALLLALDEVENRLGAVAPAAAAAASPGQRVDPELASKALLLLEDLVQRLGLDLPLGSGDDLDRLGAGVAGYLKSTLDYIWRTAQVRNEVGNQLEIDVTSMLRRERGVLENVTEPGQLPAFLLGDSRTPPDTAGQHLDRLLTDFTALQLGLLKGCQDVVRTILEALSPERLEDEAKDLPAGMFGTTAKKAALSPLWQCLRTAHARFAEQRRWEQDVIAKVRDGIRKAHLKLSEPPNPTEP